MSKLTISGHVRGEPQLHRYDDGDTACTLTLTHATDHHQSEHWEPQLYHVSLGRPRRRLRPRRSRSGTGSS
jgi:hypothetical protein